MTGRAEISIGDRYDRAGRGHSRRCRRAAGRDPSARQRGRWGLRVCSAAAPAACCAAVRPRRPRRRDSCATARRERLARPADAIRAGIGMVPGERRLGLVMNLSVRDNILLPSLDALTRAGRIDRAAGDRVVAELMELLDIRPRDASLPRGDAVGRQPAEGDPRQMAGARGRRSAARRADARRRCRRQGADPRAHSRLRAAGRWRCPDVVQRPRRADARLRQHLHPAPGAASRRGSTARMASTNSGCTPPSAADDAESASTSRARSR